jgi:hypothetical protein
MNRFAMGLLCVVTSGFGLGCIVEPEGNEGNEGRDGADPADPTADVQVSTASSEVGTLCVDDLAPVATGPTSAVTRSGVYSSSYEAWQAFDFNANSMWISAVFQTPAWIGYQWSDGPRTVTSYAINFINGSLTSRAPKDWSLQGSNNGTTWITVDSRSGQTGWLGSSRRAFTVASPGAYTRYRLNVTDDNDTRAGVVVISMGRLELLGCRP